MASGDAFCDVYTSIGSGPLTVQPGVGVTIMITAFFASSADGKLITINSSGEDTMQLGGNGNVGTAGLNNMGANLRLIFNNNEYFKISGPGAGVVSAGYTGVEL